MTQEELFAGNALIIEFDEHSNFHNYTSSKQGYLMDTIRYEDSWDLLHQVIDKINGMGKEYNFALFKTYVSLSIEKTLTFSRISILHILKTLLLSNLAKKLYSRHWLNSLNGIETTKLLLRRSFCFWCCFGF